MPQVLKLSKEDFEAGFGGHRAAGGPDQKRQKLIAFIQMVSRHESARLMNLFLPGQETIPNDFKRS